MNNYTREDILRMVEEEDVGFIRLQFTDIFGTMKNIAITTSQLDKALNNEIMFDGSAIEGFARVEESDMYLYPNLNTFEIFPWRPQQGKVARLICDVYKPDGTPYAVPVNMTRAGEWLYFHCAREGKKMDCLRACPQVCVTAVGHPNG